MRQHRHLGAYGVCVVERKALLIRKARGPYTGLLDLPGGGLAFGEEPEAALRREFGEETGLTVTNASLLLVTSRVVPHRADDGADEALHHVGLIYTVSVGAEPLKSHPDGEDSEGAAWVAMAEISEPMLTPFAYLALFGTRDGQ